MSSAQGTRARALRWGILGVAKINQRLLPAFARARNAELRAIASRSAEKAGAAASAHGIPVAHARYEALLADPDIDAVYIPLPNTMHGEWVRKAADAGKHVLCEKPLTPSAAEARQVVDYCKARGVCLMDGFMWPHHPRTARLRAFLDSGGIGEVRRVSGSFTFPLGLEDRQNIRLRPEMAGGSLLDVGCYPVFGIRWAFQAEPLRVFAAAHFLNDVDLSMTGILWFSEGRIATFDCGFDLPLRQTVEIAGTQGVVTVPDLWQPAPRATFLVRHEQKIDEVAIEGEDQIVHMLEDFGRAVLQNQPVRPAPDEAVKTLAVLDALTRSARTGQAVDVMPS
jgi:predicted dehydrogenase